VNAPQIMITEPGTGWPVIPPEHDLPHDPPGGVALWSESFFFFTYDPQPGIGVVMHITRAPFDPGIWRAIVGVYLPNDELLVSKSYGRLGSDRGPGTGPLEIECVEPLTSWQIRFDGAAQRVTSEVLAAAVLCDGPAEPLAFDLTFTASAPIFDLAGDVANHSFASAHQQQAGVITGTVTVADGTRAIDGFCYRDHGWGPRDLTTVLGDAWNAMRFDGAGLICSIDFRSEHANIMRGYGEDGGRFTEITPLQTPPLDGPDAKPAEFVLRLRRADGAELAITAEVVHYFTFTFAPPNEVLLGSYREDPGALHVCEAVVRYELDGEVGYGLCERMTRMSTLT
jgi:hypothetical protein